MKNIYVKWRTRSTIMFSLASLLLRDDVAKEECSDLQSNRARTHVFSSYFFTFVRVRKTYRTCATETRFALRLEISEVERLQDIISCVILKLNQPPLLSQCKIHANRSERNHHRANAEKG